MRVQGKLMLCLLIFAIAFSNCSNSSHTRLTSDDQVERNLSVQEDSVVVVNSCENEGYRSRLTETTSLDVDAYVLTTENKIDNIKKTHQLDFPSDRAKIMYCTRDYTVVGFACGGPCHTSVFVQHEKNVPVKTFGYCQRVKGRDDIVLYVKEELFDHLIAHNL